MAGETLAEVIRRLGRSGGLRGDLGETDADLLERFARRRDEPAFAALVARHGPMVLGVCRRLLRDAQEAEDAFQAAFLVLARKAGAIRRRALLSAWLYGVAWRVAVRLRGRAARRRECFGMDLDALPADHAAWSDMRWAVHEEVQRLPDAYRSAIVLCCLEGKTNEEAARLLRRPVGTVKSRLNRARELLRSRLTRRGLAVSVPALGTALAVGTPPASAALVDATIRAGLPFVTGGAVAGTIVSGRAVLLSQGVLRTMMFKKATFAAALVLAVAVFGGVGGWGFHSWAAAPAGDPKAPAPVGNRSKVEPPADPEKPNDATVDDIAEEFSHLPKDAQAILDGADELEVYSLNPPDGKGDEPKAPVRQLKDDFHGFQVLGKTTLKDAAARKKLAGLIEKGIAENVGAAGCFNPRHAIRATHDGKTVDLVICFECFGIQVIYGDKKSFVWTNAAPQEALDKILRDAGVPLAPKPPKEEKSDKEALQGAWKVEFVQVAGQEVTEQEQASRGIRVPREWDVSDDAIVFHNGAEGYSCPYRLNADKNPKEIDIIPRLSPYMPEKEKGPPNRGVYILDGEVWKVCLPRGTDLAYGAGKVLDRPKEMARTDADGAILITLKRVNGDDKGAAKPAAPAAKYDVVAEATQPAGSPILLKLVETNAGKEPLSYWVGGPGNYPPVAVTVRATDGAGRTRDLPLSNGQAMGGSGISKVLATGDSVTMPAATAPLPEGVYTIEFGGASARVTVKDDAEMLRKREDDLLDRIRKGEPFAQHVAAAYPTPALHQRLLKELSVTDSDAAWQAAQTLYRVEKPPPDDMPLLAQAMDKHLALEESQHKRNTPVLIYMAQIAGRIGSDDALDAVLKLARSEMGGPPGIQALGMFKQDRAAKALHDLLKSTDDGQRYMAAVTLAGRHDPAAVEELLAIAANNQAQSTWRGAACQALANYPNDPRAEQAIRGLLDDRFANGQAKDALDKLHAAQRK